MQECATKLLSILIVNLEDCKVSNKYTYLYLYIYIYMFVCVCINKADHSLAKITTYIN